MSDITETAVTNGVSAEPLVPLKRARRLSVAPPAGGVAELLAKREEAARLAKEADAEIDALIAAKRQEIAALEAVRGGVKGGAPVPAAKAKPTPAPAKPKPATAKPKGERLARRSDAEIDGIVAQLVETLKTAPGGLRAEDIKAELRLDAKALPRILKRGLSEGLIRSEGVKRATRYFSV